jgi:hypothetical protein
MEINSGMIAITVIGALLTLWVGLRTLRGPRQVAEPVAA